MTPSATTARRPTLKLAHNGPPLEAELIFDTPKTGEGKYGPWWGFTIKLLAPYPQQDGMLQPGTEAVYFADNEAVANQLMRFRKGDQFTLIATREPHERVPTITVHTRADQRTGYSNSIFEPEPFPELDETPSVPSGAPESGRAMVEQPAARYAEAIMAGYDALMAGIEKVADTYGREHARHLLGQLDLERVQAAATTLFIEANKQRRTEEISRERGR